MEFKFTSRERALALMACLMSHFETFSFDLSFEGENDVRHDTKTGEYTLISEVVVTYIVKTGDVSYINELTDLVD